DDAATAAALGKVGVTGAKASALAEAWSRIGGTYLGAHCWNPNSSIAGTLGDVGPFQNRQFQFTADLDNEVARTSSGGFTYQQCDSMGDGAGGPSFFWAEPSPGSHSVNQTFPLPGWQQELSARAFDFPDAYIAATGTASVALTMSGQTTSMRVESAADVKMDVSVALDISIRTTGEERFATVVLLRNDPATGHEATSQCAGSAGDVTPAWTVLTSVKERVALRGALEVVGEGNSASAPVIDKSSFEERPVAGGDAGGCYDPSCMP